MQKCSVTFSKSPTFSFTQISYLSAESSGKKFTKVVRQSRSLHVAEYIYIYKKLYKATIYPRILPVRKSLVFSFALESYYDLDPQPIHFVCVCVAINFYLKTPAFKFI